MGENGQVGARLLDGSTLAVGELAGRPKVRLDPDLLTPRDMKRARVILEGRNPFELLDDPIDRMVLIIWALRSRTDPAFTWAEAEDTPFSDLDTTGDEPPPPRGGPPGSPGPEAAPTPAAASRRKRPAGATAPS